VSATVPRLNFIIELVVFHVEFCQLVLVAKASGVTPHATIKEAAAIFAWGDEWQRYRMRRSAVFVDGGELVA